MQYVYFYQIINLEINCIVTEFKNLVYKRENMCNLKIKFNYKNWLNGTPLSSKKNTFHTIELPEKFINLLMKNGKKSKAYSIFYKALKILYIKNYSLNGTSISKFTHNLSENKIQGTLPENKKLKNLKTFYPLLNKATTYESPVALLSKNVKSKLNKVPANFKDKNTFNLNFSNHASRRVAWLEKACAKKLFIEAINNAKPSVEVKKVRVHGKIYQVPSIVNEKRQQALAIRWIVDSAKKKKKDSNLDFAECLALELFNALKKSGEARKKRNMVHQLAESNRAYIRFKWW